MDRRDRAQLSHPERELGEPQRAEQHPQSVGEPAPAPAGRGREHLVADARPRRDRAHPGHPVQRRRPGPATARTRRTPARCASTSARSPGSSSPSSRADSASRHSCAPHVGIVAHNRRPVPGGTTGCSLPLPACPTRDDEVTRLALAAKAGDRPRPPRSSRPPSADVRRFLAHLADPGDLDDLSQETYLRAMGALARFDARASARTWLLAIARRVAADHVRLAMRRPRQSPAPDWAARPTTAGTWSRSSTRAWCCAGCWSTWPRRSGRRSWRPRCWACPTPRRPRSATVRWGRSGPGWPGPATPLIAALAAQPGDERTDRAAEF